jgi:hypothetical protein
MKTVSATTEIQASPMEVWAVLTDLASYPRWNPLFREASGEVAAGQMITLKSAHPAGGRLMTVRATITVATPGAELRWTAGLAGLISGEHSFVLASTTDGTRLVQSETYRGLLVPVSGRILRRAQASFRELNEALGRQAGAG